MKPWEKYADTQSGDGPWSKYAKQGGDGTNPGKLSEILGSYMAFMGKEGGYGSNPAGKLFSAVQKPFQQAGEATATGIAQKFPNIPSEIPAGIGTAMQMIPTVATMANPEGPAAGTMVQPPQGLLRQLESASGGMKGSLSEQFKTPSLVFSKGTGAAKPAYQTALKQMPYEQTIFKGLTKPQDIVDKAVDVIENNGKLESQEAFIARKSLDKIKKTLNDDAFNYYRTTLDRIAKENENIATADPMHRRGMMAESLRQVMPQNKYGGASAFKMGIVPAMSALGGSVGGPVGAGAGAALGTATLSPLAQAIGVGGAGAVAKIPPRVLSAIAQYLQRHRENPNP